jgi:hypothetical protein
MCPWKSATDEAQASGSIELRTREAILPAQRPSRDASGRDLVTGSAPTKDGDRYQETDGRARLVDVVEPDAGEQQHAEQRRDPSGDEEHQRQSVEDLTEYHHRDEERELPPVEVVDAATDGIPVDGSDEVDDDAGADKGKGEQAHTAQPGDATRSPRPGPVVAIVLLCRSHGLLRVDDRRHEHGTAPATVVPRGQGPGRPG